MSASDDDTFDCGHRCCDVRSNQWHSHTVDPGDCLPCLHSLDELDPLEAVREARRRLKEGRKP